MMLPGRVTSAPPGLHGIDTSGVLNEEHCRVAKSRGFSFCIRYVSRTAGQSASDLSEAEARTILSAGLALMPVQHVAREGWSPTKQLGTTFGKNAAAHVFHIGFPQGVNVWLDLEGIKPSSSHGVVIDYCNGLRRWLRQGSLPASMSARRRFLLEKRFSGVFRPNIFGDLEARFRTYRTEATS